MNDDLTKLEDTEVVIVGTSLYKSILSAALSRYGKKVVHVDSNAFYGGDSEASFCLKEFKNQADEAVVNEDLFAAALGENDKLSKKYVLDLMPKLLYANGPMVKLLLQSKICRYLEFRNVTGFYLQDLEKKSADKDLIQVPCSRAKLFEDPHLSNTEKLKMGAFVKEADKKDPNVDPDQKFADYLQNMNLTPRLRDYISRCLAFSTADETLGDVQGRIDLFLQSYGRYGESAFLWPLFGNGELHQAFCRLSAVFGATFYLDYKKCEGINNASHANYIKAAHHVIDDAVLDTGKNFHQATVITKTSLFNNRIETSEELPKEGVDLIILDKHVCAFQLTGNGGQVAPHDAENSYFVYYFFCESLDNLKETINGSIGNTSDSHVATFYMKQTTGKYFDYAAEIAAAEQKFMEICGADAKFLEQAPDPEDIVLEDKKD